MSGRQSEIVGIHIPESAIGCIAFVRSGQRSLDAEWPVSRFFKETNGLRDRPAFYGVHGKEYSKGALHAVDPRGNSGSRLLSCLSNRPRCRR